jgi:hypothetical protein
MPVPSAAAPDWALHDRTVSPPSSRTVPAPPVPAVAMRPARVGPLRLMVEEQVSLGCVVRELDEVADQHLAVGLADAGGSLCFGRRLPSGHRATGGHLDRTGAYRATARCRRLTRFESPRVKRSASLAPTPKVLLRADAITITRLRRGPRPGGDGVSKVASG